MIAAALASAQTRVDLAGQGRNVDFSGASATKPLKAGTELPQTCSVGELFFKTSSPAGANLFACTARDSWTVQAGNGAGGSVGVAAGGTVVAARPTINLVAGPGVESLVTDTGSQVNVRMGADQAVVQTHASAQGGAALLCAAGSIDGANYRCALSPVAAAYTRGMLLHWVPSRNGAGGATTLDVDTLGATPVKRSDGTADPQSADIVAGRLYEIWHDGQVFRMLRAASETSGGAAQGGLTGAAAPLTYDAANQTVGCARCVDTSQSYADPPWISSLGWSKLAGIPAAFPPAGHAAAHQAGGSDAVATDTPAPNAIPMANTGGTLAPGWIPVLNQNTTGNAATATNLAGGASGQYPYQSSAGVTAFATANTANGPVTLDSAGNAAFPGSLTAGPSVLSATAGLLAPVAVSTSGPVNVGAAGFYFNNAAGAITYSLPAITAANVGARFCFRNIAGKTGAITLQLPPSTYMDKEGANGTAAGAAVSSGALGDTACVLAASATQYVLYIGAGTWTNN